MILIRVDPDKCINCQDCESIIPRFIHGPILISDNIRDEEMRDAAYRAQDNCPVDAIIINKYTL